MRLKDKVAVITGVGAGMGRAIALAYAREGAKVVGVEFRDSLLEPLVEEAKELPGEIFPLQGDLMKEGVIDKMFETALEQYGTLDIYVNNAAIMDNFAPVEDCTDESWDRIILMDLTVPFKATRKAVQILSKNEKGGSIIIIGATGGCFRGGCAGVAYTSAKGGLIQLMKNVAVSSYSKNIRCNSVCPGGIRSDIQKVASSFYPEGMHPEGTKIFGKLNGAIPKVGLPEDIAPAVVFLGSDESNFVNGAYIFADAGWNAHM